MALSALLKAHLSQRPSRRSPRSSRRVFPSAPHGAPLFGSAPHSASLSTPAPLMALSTTQRSSQRSFPKRSSQRSSPSLSISKGQTPQRHSRRSGWGPEQTSTFGSAAGPTPVFTEKAMPKVSLALQCVMGLSIQYFVVYTVLAMDRTDNQFTSNAHLGVRKILETACTLLTCATMLSAHFLAALMLAIKFAQDETKPYKMPQPWAQTAMFCCVHAVQSQAILMLVIPVLNHESEVSMDEH